MKEKYESLSLAVLKDLAKARGLKKISGLKKAELIERMLEEDAREEQQKKNADSLVAETAGAADANPQKTETAGTTETDPHETEIAGAADAARQKTQTTDTGDSVKPKRKPAKTAGPKRTPQKKNAEKAAATNAYTVKAEPIVSDAAKDVTDTAAVTDAVNADRNVPTVTDAAKDAGDATAAANDSKPFPNDTEERNPDLFAVNETPKEQAESALESAAGESQERKSLSGSGQRNLQRGKKDASDQPTGVPAHGILEVMQDGFGFIRCENYLPGENDVYVSPSLIRRFNLKTGDIITGNKKEKSQSEKFSALLFISEVNGLPPYEAAKRPHFEDLTPIFPNERIRLETRGSGGVSMRIVDLIAPVGKGQRGMIVSPPKAGKTTLLKEAAKAIKKNNPEMYLLILLIDERPEEVTDMKEAIEGENVEVIYSTFDELPEHHKRVSEMVIERAKRLVEHKQDVIILLDSITRLARAYNMVVPPSGRTLSGGLDPAALHMPKRFFGAARNMREGGSLTILATALVDTGSKMDDVVYEEFKGTGNMELVLDRRLSERRIFPAIDIVKSGTRREDLLLDPPELDAVNIIRRSINGMKTDEAVESIQNLFLRTRNNIEFVNYIRKQRRGI